MTVEVTVIKSTTVDPSLLQQITATMPEWFQLGGGVMWLLLLTSFIVTIITLERAITWIRYGLKKEHFPLNDCFASLNKDQKEQAVIFCQSLETPGLIMLKHGITALPFSPQEKLRFYATQQIKLMAQGQTLLRSAFIIALMLGVLGTLVALIDALQLFSHSENLHLGVIFSAISHALISSVFGLCIALLAFIPYRLFQVQGDKLTQHLQKISCEFNAICQRKSLVTNHISEIVALQKERMSSELEATETVAEHSEMPYHYEFKEGSDEVNVSLHKEMKGLHKTSQSSLVEMYEHALENNGQAPLKKTEHQ